MLATAATILALAFTPPLAWPRAARSNLVANGIGLVIHAELAFAERITSKRHEGGASTAAASST